MLVLLHNLTLDAPAPNAPLRLLQLATTAGWVGVTLFFALSGYLITSILLRTRDDRAYLRNFFARRVLRIFPLYYATLVLVLLVVPRLVRLPAWSTAEMRHQIWFWTYLSNWVVPLDRGITGLDHCWSLAVEEQFYLAWPFLVRMVSARRLAMVCLLLAAFALASRVLVRATGAVNPIANYYWTSARIDALALGALGAIAMRTGRDGGATRTHAWLSRWRDRLLIATGAALAALALATRGLPRHHPAVDTVGYTLLSIGAALIVVRAAGTAGGTSAGRWRAFDCPLLLWLGRYSYGVYVFHGILDQVVPRMLPTRWLRPTGGAAFLATAVAYVLSVSAVSAALAFLSYHLFEKRFLALKSRFSSGAPDAHARLAG